MNKWKKGWIPIFMALMLMLSGCGADVQEESQPSKNQTVTEQQQETVEQEDWEIIDESEPTINIGFDWISINCRECKHKEPDYRNQIFKRGRNAVI